MNGVMPPPAPSAAAQAPQQRRHRWGHLSEPRVLFPLLSVLLLGVLWTATVGLIRQEYANGRAAAIAATQKITETYEAQIVRSLREIDRTLGAVAYTYSLRGSRLALPELNDRGLLLPPFLFTISITDRDGNLIASTRDGQTGNVADTDYFRAQQGGTVFAVGLPTPDAQGGGQALSFSRRLEGPDGGFAGVAVVSVDASYFVSGYEPIAMGERGFLGLLGRDGIFRVTRSGETVASGARVDFDRAVPQGSDDLDATPVTLSVNPWDGVRRYTAARALFEFPLAVVVGLSTDEQLLPAHTQARRYWQRSAIASVALLTIMTLLGRLSWQLQQSRLREAQEQIEHARRVEYIAHHDSLTGLPNRGFFSQLLNQSLASAKRYQHELAVLFLDLDRFKLINDTLGHDAGDDLLKQVAERLSGAVRESDVVARLGGDEFVVLLPEQCDEASLIAVSQRILESIGKPYVLAGNEFRVTVSIGVSRYPGDAEDEQSLLKNADIAMYRAKESGRNNFLIYRAETDTPSLERLNLEAALRLALERQEFSIYYQDQLDLRSGEVTGTEALLRWRHPQLGVVLPRQFLPLAEDTGLIVPIGKWVIETVCRDCVAQQASEDHRVTRIVNLSARQLADEHLLRDLKDIVQRTGIDPSLLELGIAEEVILKDMPRVVKILTDIRALGVRVAIDNFGASYSSLSTLRRFRFDTVNIDRSVIRDAAHSAEDRRLTEATIALGKRLAFTVVAEGVETEDQAAFLRAAACDKAQGFLFGHPEPRERTPA
jgi:diguanylate cyclase (GGDEF)-like protein